MIFPTTSTSVRQLVGFCPPAEKLLKQLGIDAHRRRHATLSQACREAGVDPRRVLEVTLTAAGARRAINEQTWEDAPIDELSDHVIATHHGYLRHALPRIRLLIDKAIHDDGDSRPELHQLRDVFATFELEMQRYLLTEEEVLFPLIRQLARAQRRPGCFAGTVNRSVKEVGERYRTADEALEQLWRLTRQLDPPRELSPAYTALVEELQRLERDLKRHEYLEKEVLFPRAMNIEHDLLRQHG